MLSIRRVTHRFGKRDVLSNIDLDVQDGEIIAIMGSSGGGKTTLLKCISGLIIPSEGDILIDDLSVVRNPDKAREKLGLVFQSAALFDFMNVFDNVAFGLRRKVRGISSRELEEIVESNLRQVGLEGSSKLMPSELSGGMRKRVGLARALTMEPKVILYDEPTSGLDPVTAYSIDQMIVETRNRLGMTSIVVSHDVSSVFRVADRIAFLESGRLSFVGTAEEFRQTKNGAITDLVSKARAESLA